MDTEDFQWRICARCVAYLDLALSGIVLVNSSVVCIIWVARLPSILDFHSEQYSDVQQFIPLLFAAIFIAVCMEIWCSTLLLKATRPGVDSTYALYKAAVWRNINVLFMMFSIIIKGLGSCARPLGSVLDACELFLVFQGFQLVLVCKYIKELREAAGSPSISDA